MHRSLFHIPGMDCPAEENIVRLALEPLPGINRLEFDLARRTLVVYGEYGMDDIEQVLAGLGMGSVCLGTAQTEATGISQVKDERKLLITVLAINAAFFALEMTAGLISGSMGLVADSLDMLADAFVYGLSLIAVGGAVARKKRIARLAGYFQIALALLGFAEVLRRFFGIEAPPEFRTMIIVSAAALIANAFCLLLLQRARSSEAHMKASMIFTSNDVIINAGVIAAGVLVYALGSGLPDLIIGAIVFVLVMRGARRILRLGR